MKSASSLCLRSALLITLGLSPVALLADSQLIVNGGFENGVYTSTLSGSTNSKVPVSWTPNLGFDSYPQYDQVVTTGGAHGGLDYLSIGNLANEPVPTLSQTFSDVSGSTYNGSIWVKYGGAGTTDTSPYFDVSVDSVNLVSLNYLAAGIWTDYTFSFTGTGSDTLTLAGNTNPSEWFVDDVSVTGSLPASVTPEPSSLLLLGTGILGGAAFIRRSLRIA